MIGEAYRSIDFIARLAEAWDQLGRHPFSAGGTEHRALLCLAYLPPELAAPPIRRWNDLTAEQRRRLVVAARAGIDFGRHCAWVFGEGNGA